MITLADVTKTYATGSKPLDALRGVTLTIDRGEFVAVMGPSGSGKSTLLHLMGALDVPTQGEVTIDGRSTTALTDRELTLLRRDDIGFVFQAFNLIAVLTAQQNVALPCVLGSGERDECVRRATEALATVGLAERLDARPSELSGGEQQRVAIARALVNQPKIILADEPTGNLDHHTSLDVMKTLRDLNAKGQTIVLATHDPAAATFAARVVALRDGEVVKESTLRRGEDTTRFRLSLE